MRVSVIRKGGDKDRRTFVEEEMVRIKFEAIGGKKAAPARCHRTKVIFLLAVMGSIIVCQLLEPLKQLLVLVWSRSSSSPHRLRLEGKHLYVAGQSEPCVLRGFDLMFKYGANEMNKLTRQDKLLNLVHGVTLVRLIMNHWMDDVTSENADCYDASANDFLRPACLEMFDEVVQWATGELGVWVIITARSALAAGDGGPGRTIFDNATLRSHWVAMWSALARRYAETDRIAGFEVMSEPRTYAPASQVHATQQLACSAIFEGNPGALCIVGAARFYDRFNLNASYLIKGGPAMYAANFFAPRSWVSNQISPQTPNASYPGDFPCCDLYQKDQARRHSVCGGSSADACALAPLVHANRFWLEDQLRAVLSFRDNNDVPVWIDQWGVRANAAGGHEAHEKYLFDIVDVFRRERLHWTYWIWRRTSKPPDWTCEGFAVICQTVDGSYYIQERLLSHLSSAIASKDKEAYVEIDHNRMNDRVEIGAKPKHKLSPFLYSMFYETEINFAGTGGLYAELIRNRGFEALGRGCVDECPTMRAWLLPPLESIGGRDPHEPAAVTGDFRPWSAVGAARLQIDNTTAPFATNPNSLRVEGACTADGAPHAGAQNPGFWGIASVARVELRLKLYARSARNSSLDLMAMLIEDGRVIAEASLQRSSVDAELKDGWAEYHATLLPLESATAAVLDVVVACGESNFVFWLDGVSLMPSDAVGGLFRRDLFDRLRLMRPGFVRMPGGNYLEGFGIRTRWDWRKTLGHWAARPGHYNAAWGYWSEDGLGLYEMLRLCELLESTCQLSVFTGYSLKAPYIPLSRSERFAQEALDMLEFANSEVTSGSELAARREQMGHPAPFGVSRLEVGNEERTMAPDDYPAHYELIARRLREKHPWLTIIASGRWKSEDDIIGSPCLNGQRCDEWDEHFYQTPDEMALMGSWYDMYNRSRPKVFVGEFAANKPFGAPTLRAAIAESIFMLGFERNADVISASAFAPLLSNVRAVQWNYSLINFDSSRVFCLPSYHAQRLLSEVRGSHSLATRLLSETIGVSDVAVNTWSASASLVEGLDEGRLVLKLANYGELVRTVNVSLASWIPRVPVTASAKVLTGASPDAVNSLDDPEAITSAAAPPPVRVPNGLLVELPAWSLMVIRVQMG